ncbi:MAG: DNA-binding protein [Bacilli bacterium]|jgi:predicted DNA-binding protein YlxM (UPF0122 family)|nr:DNA-binding protein [Bacilli bacterium]
MEKFVYYTKLFDCYEGLLNENERLTFSYYYEENLSMQEIAEKRGVSKSAIGATIKNIEIKLTAYERILHLESKQEQFERLLQTIKDEKIKEEIKKIIK